MNPLRIVVLCVLLSLVAAYPVAEEVPQLMQPQLSKPQAKPEASVKSEKLADLDPADYPDLTNGLTDAEIESTLNGLSLDDLNELNKLLDDAGDGPFDLQASLRGYHRQAKKQHHAEIDNVDDDMEGALKSGKQPVDDSCHDEDDSDSESMQRPKCKRPTTRRCSATTRKCTTACQSLDGFLDIHIDGPKSGGTKLRTKTGEECDPQDTICLQRAQHRSKQRPSVHDFAEVYMDHDSNNLNNLEQTMAQAHRDGTFKHNKQRDSWKDKADSMPDMSNMDLSKYSNVYTADLEEVPKLGTSWAQEKVAADEKSHAQQIHEDNSKQLELKMPYQERYELAHAVRARTEQLDDKSDDYKQADEREGLVLDENMQMNSAPAVSDVKATDESEAAEAAEPLTNDGDSFIAQNAREPMRYLNQNEDGYFKSEDEPIEEQLEADKTYSELLSYNSSPAQTPPQQSKRIKREDTPKTDDAPENHSESYLKKLLDSFPRDQVGQSNLNMVIREAKRTHLRVKRS